MIFEVLTFGVLLPLVVAAVVLVVASRVGTGGRTVGPLLAIVAGFAVGNHFRPAAEYRFDSDRPLALGELFAEVSHAVSGGADEATTHPPARYWLPWTALIVGVGGLLARAPRVPPVVGWLLRAVIAVLVARLLVPTSLRAEVPWLWVVFAAIVLAEGGLLDAFAEHPWLPFGLGLVFLAAGAVLIHAHSARLTDLATMMAGSWLGVALAAWWTGATVRSAVPIAAVSLPGLLLVGQQTTYSDVPMASFILAGLAPLALCPLLLPVLPRPKRGLTLAGLTLLLLMAGTAVGLAVRAETLLLD